MTVGRGVATWGQRLVALTWKELLHLWRDVPLLLFLIYSFSLSVLVSGAGITMQLTNAELLVHDEDQSPSSRELIHRFQPPYFALVGAISDPREGLRQLEAAAFDLVVANFSLIGGEAVDALIRHVPALLVPHGTLLIQTLHPATARGEHPYVDGWREGSWAGFSRDFRDPPPWFYRTMGSWIRLLVRSGFQVQDVVEPLHPVTGNPASVLFVAVRA